MFYRSFFSLDLLSMHLYIFILLLLNPFVDSKISFSDRENFFLDYNLLHVFLTDRYLIVDLDTEVTSEVKLKVTDFNFNEFYVEKVKNRVLFFQKSGGNVYELLHDTISQIDKSYTHRLQYRSLNFTNNSTHYRFGGYGFFERSKSLIFYNNETNEWDLKYNFDDQLESGINDFTFHKLDEGVLTLFGGFTSDKGGHSLKYENSIFELDISNDKLKRIGNLASGFPTNKINYITSDGFTYLLGSDKRITVYDENKNTFWSNQTFKKPKYLIGVYDDKLFFFTHSTYQNNNLQIDSLDLNLLNKSDFSKSIYNQTNHHFLLSLFLIILLLIILFLFDNSPKLKSKISLSKDGFIDSKNQLIKLNTHQIELIIFLKKHQKVDNNSLLDFLGNNTYDIGHQNRVKNKLVKSINDVVFSRFEDQLILVEKNSTDKRSISFFLNKGLIN